MSHDQLSKSLISTFFYDFLRLAVPDSAPRLRPGEATFLDKELFSDWPSGNRREPDLLAQVPLEAGEVPVLVHIEIETEARAGMDQRLWRYYMQIRLRYKLLVLTILVNLRGGRPGVGVETLEEGVEATPPVVFPYRVLGLSGCQAEDWLSRPEPVAWAFAALMRPGAWTPAELKMACLRRVARSEVTGFRKEVLTNWIETYVQFSEEDAAEFRQLLALEENKEVQEMELTWLEQAEARAEERVTRRDVELLRRKVLRLVERRFGAVPKPVQEHLEAIDSMEPLTDVIEKIAFVQSAEELVGSD